MEWRHFLSVKDFKDISIQSKIKFAQKFLEDKLPNKITNEAGLFHSFPMNYPDLINDKARTTIYLDGQNTWLLFLF